jgi:REP element-mobilizing transposase RayT
MARFARIVVPQCPHHITQRGNERRDVFFTAGDRDTIWAYSNSTPSFTRWRFSAIAS